MAAAYSKLEAYGARFALLHHVVTHAIDRAGIEFCNLESIENGIQFVTWAQRETERVYAMLGAGDEETKLNEQQQEEYLEFSNGQKE